MRKFDRRQPNLSLSKQRNMAENAEIQRLKAAYKSCDSKSCRSFADMPLSSKTLRGLTEASFKVPTGIQRDSIPLALKGRDILGAAKTGSGKTLAFVIPALERLFVQSWSHMDGCGVLIVTPTRELAAQIFEVLRSIGKLHSFSAGVVIGGKSLRDESQQIRTTNIIICTPGRLRQHMEETYNFELGNLLMLVLDEADRMLDMGFKRDMDIIFENMPAERQTLLFSATQTKSLNDLARLSLQNPVFVSAHELSEFSTPDDLRQNYLICEQYDKLNILFSFIKSHLQQKTLVFVSTCKQVKFVFAAFCKFRPGTSVMALHGDLNQMKRIGVYQDFCKKQRGILLATDVAARGLDFPGINWVVQMDCPDSAESYIHRVGRTARFEKGGQALLFLLPSEKAMLDALQKRRVPIVGIKTNPKQIWNIDAKMQSLCASDISMKERAQRAFVAFMRCTFLMSDKTIFKTDAIDLDKFAKSLGLATAPSITFSGNAKNKEKKDDVEKKVSDVGSKFDLAQDEDGEEEEDLLVPVGKVEAVSDDEEEILPEKPSRLKNMSKIALAKRSLRMKVQSNKRIVFSGEGEAQDEEATAKNESSAEDESSAADEEGGAVFDFGKALQKLAKADVRDKAEWQQRIRSEHRRKRLAVRQRNRETNKQNDVVVRLTSADDVISDGDGDSSEAGNRGEENDDELMRNDVVGSSESDYSGGDSDEDDSGDGEESPGAAKRRCTVTKEDEELALKLLSSR